MFEENRPLDRKAVLPHTSDQNRHSGCMTSKLAYDLPFYFARNGVLISFGTLEKLVIKPHCFWSPFARETFIKGLWNPFLLEKTNLLQIFQNSRVTQFFSKDDTLSKAKRRFS